MYSTIGSRRTDLEEKIKTYDESDTDDGDDGGDDIIEQLRRDQEYYPVKEQEGLYYKVINDSVLDLGETTK